MENVITITKNFGCVPCGQKTVKTIKIENKTKITETLSVKQKYVAGEILNSRLRIHPQAVVTGPKQIACFKLIYLSGVENIIDNFHYEIWDSENIVAELHIHVQSIGPAVSPIVHNIRFFCLHDVNQTVKNVELVNDASQDAKFYFDICEDYRQLEISKMRGIIPAGLKLSLTFVFNPIKPGVFYKKIFCIVMFQEPLVFNITAVCKPRLKLNPKGLVFVKPPEIIYSNNYEAFMKGQKPDQTYKKVNEDKRLQNSCKDLELKKSLSTEDSESENEDEIPNEDTFWPEHQPGADVFLTRNFIDVENSAEYPGATALTNFSVTQAYYFQWNYDPKNNFQIVPCQGLIEPHSKMDFAIYFSPSKSNSLFYTEIDLNIFPCNEDRDISFSGTVDLPLTCSLRIIGHSFAEGSCGWVPQCKISPKVLYLASCVPGEVVYGTFIIEREGHLPVNFLIMPQKEKSFSVHPPLGHISKDYQLFVVEFNSSEKSQGIYTEDLKIKFNHSDLNIETIKLVASVELPLVIFDKNNSYCFPAVYPGSQINATITVINLTNLSLSYELKTPEDIDWVEIVNPKCTIEPKCKSKVKAIFKPEVPCEYLDYIPCEISSITKPDYVETVHLQLVGSCQYGFLVATPSIHDFGKCNYMTTYPIQVHLFNFSPIMIYYKLTAVDLNFVFGDAKRDVAIYPNNGKVPPKESVQVVITIAAHHQDIFKYDIECQNFGSDSLESEPCGASRKIMSLTFEGVLPTIQILDLALFNGGPLFSPYWLWKMLEVDQVNKAFNSIKSEQIILASIPSGVKNSPTTKLCMMIEANKYGPVSWNVNLEIQCPCYEASAEKNLNQCLHTKAMFLCPSKQSLGPLEKILLLIKINYNFTNECTIVMTFSLSGRRTIKLKMPLVSVPNEIPTAISSYQQSTFHLKPIFIGDPLPPTQLIWLYNNTPFLSSYSVNVECWEVKEQKVFDCLNPMGVIQPYSSYPLEIVFSPKELITYSEVLRIQVEVEGSDISIELVGEGVLNFLPLEDISKKKTVPEAPLIKNQKVKIECNQNIVNINFLRVFSQTKRFFFIHNRSSSKQWSFHWESFHFENLFSVWVKPKKGVLNPGEKAQMTLFFQSYCHPTFIGFSVPCEVISFSDLKAHEERFQLQKLIDEKEKELFTITEKGVSYQKTVIPEVPKPTPYHIFITVTANVISNLHADQILSQKQRSTLRVEKEIQNQLNLSLTLKPPTVKFFQELLENIFWDLLSNDSVVKQIESSKNSQDFIYRQLLPESKKKRDDYVKYINELPEKYLIQKILDCTIQDIISKNSVPE